MEDVVCEGKKMRVNLLKDDFVRGRIINAPQIDTRYKLKKKVHEILLF